MSNRHLVILAIFFVSLVNMNFRCAKIDIDSKPFDHTFVAAVDIYPLKKTYALTDTIWLETDVTGKVLFDSKTNQNILADTGRITFGVSFNEFGTYITSPPNGFCDIITINGVNSNRQLYHWGTSGSIENFGCGQPGYRTKIGFKPNQTGIYGLFLNKDIPFESCPNKIIPYYATISYKYKNVDLNMDIFNSLSKNDKGGASGARFNSDKINNRELFVFRVL